MTPGWLCAQSLRLAYLWTSENGDWEIGVVMTAIFKKLALRITAQAQYRYQGDNGTSQDTYRALIRPD